MENRKLPPKAEDIEAITEEANRRIHKNYPMLENSIQTWMTQVILEVAEDLKIIRRL